MESDVKLYYHGHSQNINWESGVKSLGKESVDSSFLNEFSQSCHSQNTQSKSLAEDILIEEISMDICSNCDEHIDGSDCQVCEVCDRLCHPKCLLKVDCCMVCYGCEASIKQMNTPQGVVAEDTVSDIDEVITSTQNLISKNINCEVMASGRERTGNSSVNTFGLQLQAKVSTVDFGTQTVALSELELQKKSKELNAKEKSLNKKECELSQLNSQLTVAKSKIILLEKEISDLHKENDLLKSNLLLAQPGADNSRDRQNYTNNNIDLDRNSASQIENRLARMEFEMLKSRVERLESACNGSKEEGKGYYEQRISAVEKTNEKITTILESLVKSIKQNGQDPEKTLGLAFLDKVDVNRDYQNNQNSMNTSDGEQDSSVIVLPEEERRDKLITKINPEVHRCKLQGNQSTKVTQLEKKLYTVPARQNVVPQEEVPLDIVTSMLQ